MRSSRVAIETPQPPPDFNRHVLKQVPIETIWQFINPLMLYTRHLGLKGGDVRKWSQKDIAELRENLNRANARSKSSR